MTPNKYPLGIQTFEKVRVESRLYLDKTEYVYRMTHGTSSYVFLSRHAVLVNPYWFRP